MTAKITPVITHATLPIPPAKPTASTITAVATPPANPRAARSILQAAHELRLRLISVAKELIAKGERATGIELATMVGSSKSAVNNHIAEIRKHPEVYGPWPFDGEDGQAVGVTAPTPPPVPPPPTNAAAEDVAHKVRESVKATPGSFVILEDAATIGRIIDLGTFIYDAAPEPSPGVRAVDIARATETRETTEAPLAIEPPPAADSRPSAVGDPPGTGEGAGEGGEVASNDAVLLSLSEVIRSTADEARRLAKNERKRLARAKAREAKASAKAVSNPPATPPTSPVDASPPPAAPSAPEPPAVAPVGGQDAGERSWPAEPEPVYVIHPFEPESTPDPTPDPPSPASPPKAKPAKPSSPAAKVAAKSPAVVPSKPLTAADLAKLPREDRVREYRRLAEHATDLDSRILRFSWNYYEGSGRFPTDLLIADKFNVSTGIVARVAEGWAAKDAWICRRVKPGVPPGPVAQFGIGAPKGSRDAGYLPTPEDIDSAKAVIQADWPHERPEDRRLPSQPEAKAANGVVAMRRAGMSVDGGRSV